MTEYLVDSGIWLAARDPKDRFRDSAQSIIKAGAAGELTLAALDLTLYEIANVAGTRWSSPQTARSIVSLLLETVGDRLVRAEPILIEAAAVLASAGPLSAYDAAYVACSRARGWTLVSTDLRDLVRPGLAVSPDGVL